MNPALLVAALVLVPLLVVGLYVLVTYNRLVKGQVYIESSWSSIDVELTRRYDLIPNLVETVKGYAAHEAGVLQAVTEARAEATAHAGDSPAERAPYEDALSAAAFRLRAVAEAYPDLKASANFLDLQNELTNTEDRLATARRVYNSNVRTYNEDVRTVPSNLVAAAFKFRLREFFEASPAARVTPTVSFGG